MSEVLYEQYKDALRRGHVAALRGRLDVAAAAYREAARIAPDRALPYVGLGGVLARLGRTDDALARLRAPRSTGRRPTRARCTVAPMSWPPSGRRAEAADMLDRLASILERDGRLADACDVARGRSSWPSRADDDDRSRASSRRLRTTAPEDAAAAEALQARAGRPRVGAGRRAQPASAGPTAAATCDGRRRPAARPGRRDPALLTLAVEEALEAGDLDEARRRALVAAIGHRAVGQFHAAMDACYQALAIQPSDPDIHLLLAELYLDRGWRGPAADKLVLLGRLSQLTGDGATRAGCATSRRPDSPTTLGWRRSAPEARLPSAPSASRTREASGERCYTRARCRSPLVDPRSGPPDARSSTSGSPRSSSTGCSA